MPEPLDLNGPLTQEALKRVTSETTPTAPNLGLVKNDRPSVLSPDIAMILGSIADGISTYSFLDRNAASEANPLYSSLNNDPAKTGLAVAGTGLASVLLKKLLKDKFPSMASILDAHTSNVAAGRINAASEGITTPSRYAPTSPLNNYKTKIVREIVDRAQALK